MATRSETKLRETKPVESTRNALLDPIEHASEIVFGVLMAMSITGSLSVATAGEQEVRTMMLAALGCNLAWGLTDAIMYLVGTAAERLRKVSLLRELSRTKDAAQAHRLIADALPERLADAASERSLEAIRVQLLAAPLPSARLGANDYAAALAVFGLVVISTFPVVIPFVFLHDAGHAMRVSNLLAVLTLFAGGYVLGRHARANPWGFGFAMAGIGAVLVAAIIALGG
jgi:VIT1/CCC1 family predicted Fe2+/Mn2+ transporter